MLYNNTPLPVAPIVKLSGYDDKEWELFIEECVDVLTKEKGYKRIIGFGGAGDKGRDICAYTENESIENTWDLYQAKHYGANSTTPTNFFPELAKFFDMLVSNQYSIPREYFLCTLRIGPKLIDYFLNKNKFKEEFINAVIKSKGIFPKYRISVDLKIYLDFLNNFNFQIFNFLTPKELIIIHKNSPHHWRRFGELPLREKDPSVPKKINDYEQVYITELIRLYNDFSGENFTINTINERFSKHLYSQRKAFFIAEGLQRFSRDKLPNEFDKLLEEIFDALAVLLYGFHNSNMEKFDKIIIHANSLKISNSPLSHRLKPSDMSGCCHHLVNNKKFKWVDDE